MTDVKYDQEKLQKESQEFMDKFRKRMKDIADETLGDLYVNVMPYMETDTWTNYREALRIDEEVKFLTCDECKKLSPTKFLEKLQEQLQ